MQGERGFPVGRVLHVRPAERRRFRPAQPALKQQADNRLVHGAPVGCGVSLSSPRPVRRGMAAVARMAAQSSAVSPCAWPRPRPAA